MRDNPESPRDGRRASGAPVVDAHAYFGAHMPEGMLHPAHDAGQLVRVLDEAGIDMAVISAPDWIDIASSESPPYSESTRAVFAAAEAHPDRLIPLVRVNPNWRDQSIAAFAELARHPLCRGLKLHPQWDYFPVASKLLVDPLLAICDKHGLAVFFSVGTYPAAQPMPFMDIATKWPKVKFGLVHAGLRLNHDVIIVAERCENVAVICTPQVAAPTVQTLVRCLGPERIMFGSEAPLDDPAHSLRVIRSMPSLSATEKQQVLGVSAARWLALQPATVA